MKFVQRSLERTADNSSGRESPSDKLKNLVSVVVVMAIIYILMGFVADFVAMRVSEKTEARIFGPAVVTFLQTDSAPPEFKLAEKTFNQLIRSSNLRPLPYHLEYLDETMPNAFAVPGGGVIITRGLLNMVTNQTALAFVLGHELGHHQHRHTLQGIGRKLLVKLVFNFLFGSSPRDAVSGTLTLAELEHSRLNERQADAFGFRLAYSRYGDSEGYLDFFEKLCAEQDDSGSHWLKFMNSHPPTVERLVELKRLRKQLVNTQP